MDELHGEPCREDAEGDDGCYTTARGRKLVLLLVREGHVLAVPVEPFEKLLQRGFSWHSVICLNYK